MRLVCGLAVGLFLMLGGDLLEGGHFASLIQLTGAIIVLGGTAGAMIVAYPRQMVSKSFILAVSGRDAPPKAYVDAARIFKSLGDLALLSGFAGSIFGVIHVLEHLDHLDSLGAGIAVAATSILYGLLIKLFVGKPLYDSFMSRAAT